MFAPPSPRTATFGSLVSALSPPVLFSSLCGATSLGDVASIVLLLLLLTVYGGSTYVHCVCVVGGGEHNIIHYVHMQNCLFSI